MSTKKRTLGRLLVGQSGGCTQVINSSLRGIVETALRSPGVTGVWGMRHGIEGLLRGDVSDLSREKAATLRAIGRVPAAALGSCRHKMSDAEAEAAARLLAANDIGAFLYIGGNDSADTTHRIGLAARRLGHGLRAIAAPKTIDNDLPVTHHCPGYGSAARFIASVVADTGMETEAMRTVEPVKVIEVMGRNAGWLACAAVLAKRSDRDAPHLIWPPEVPFDERRFLRLVRDCLARVGWCVVVVTETLRDAKGHPVGARSDRLERDAFGHPRLTGVAEHLCLRVKSALGVRARWDKPGTIQRMSSAHLSPVDLAEAYACGRWAVRFALEGRSDCMVVMRRRRGRIIYDTTPIRRVANREKRLPLRWFDAARMLPTDAFRRYALPLAGDLPAHARLACAPAPFVR